MRPVLGFLKPYRATLALVLALVFVQALAELGLPTLMARLIDRGVLGGHPESIVPLGLAMVAVALVGAGASITSSWVSATLGSGFGRDLRRAVFERSVRLDIDKFAEWGPSSLITRATNDVTQVQSFVLMGTRMLAVAPLMALGGIVMAFSLDRVLAIVLLLAVPLVAVVVALVARRGVVLFRMVQQKIDRLNLVLRESLTGVRVIRAFDRSDFDQARFSEANLDLTQVSLQTQKLMAVVWPGMMLAMSLTGMALVGFGSVRIQWGDLQVGGLMAFLQYSIQILFSLMLLSILFVIGPRAAVSAQRIAEVLATGTSDSHQANSGRCDPHDNLRFDGVSYRYPGAEQPALDNVSFTIPAGKMTALIGGTGSGKSTILSLLLRFRDPTTGRIWSGMSELSSVDPVWWRQQVGFVPQKSRLFSASVGENVRWGRPDAEDSEVDWALGVSQSSEFVDQLPDKAATHVESGGTNLSGGQRQRLTLARALVRRAPLLLLDDGVSALDFKTEADVRRALRNEQPHATVVLVAQRVASVRDADHIIVMDEGRVAGEGTHESLLATCSVYREIIVSQTEPEAANE